MARTSGGGGGGGGVEVHYTRNTFADVLAFTSCRSKSAWIPLRSFLRRRHLRSRTRFVPLLSRVPVPLSLSRSFSLARSFTCSRVSPFLPPLCRLLKNPDLRLKVYIKELGRESRLSTLVMIGVSFSLSFPLSVLADFPPFNIR